MIDKESERTLSGWLRLGDRLTGRKAVEGRCDRCGETRYLAEGDRERICAACYLAGEAVTS
jgi:ribosomal protein L37E